MEFAVSEILQWAARALEVAGVGAVLAGALAGTVRYLAAPGAPDAFRLYRRRVGLAILLGLEFLVAADIIATITLEPDLEGVLVLGAVVLIRTFLSFSLEIELEGRLPWRQGDPLRQGRREQGERSEDAGEARPRA